MDQRGQTNMDRTPRWSTKELQHPISGARLQKGRLSRKSGTGTHRYGVKWKGHDLHVTAQYEQQLYSTHYKHPKLTKSKRKLICLQTSKRPSYKQPSKRGRTQDSWGVLLTPETATNDLDLLRVHEGKQTRRWSLADKSVGAESGQ